MKHRVMIVDDEPNVRSSIKIFIEDKYYVIEAESGQEALDLLEKVKVDLILLDIWMEDMNGIEVLKQIKKNETDVAVIMVTVEQDVKKVVDAMKLGAYDYIVKPFNESELLISIERALENIELKQTKIYLESELMEKWKYYELVGKSESMMNLFNTIDKVSQFDANILITGETGVGKELVARAIHKKCLRSDKPFIAINCGAIPINLIESELFGYESGAFTGATARKKGKFELANGGVIFLDEISELSLESQVKLMRILQSGEFSRLGGVQTLYTDVRIFAATNQDLEKLMSINKFRKDLYYRINVVKINVPPLREKREDIPILVKYFIKKYSKEMNIKEKSISEEVLNKLQTSSEWKGNVRELENKVVSALILSKGSQLEIHNFFPDHEDKIKFTDVTPFLINQAYSINLKREEFENLRKKIKIDMLKAFDRIFLERIKKKVNGNIERAIKETGINRTYFYYLIKRAEMTPEEFQI